MLQIYIYSFYMYKNEANISHNRRDIAIWRNPKEEWTDRKCIGHVVLICMVKPEKQGKVTLLSVAYSLPMFIS